MRSWALVVALAGCAAPVPPAVDDVGPRSDGGTPIDAAAIDAAHVASDAPTFDAGPPPSDPCATTGGCPLGTWVDVTPPSVDPRVDYGVKYVMADAMHPERFYAMFLSQGVWRSDDYGQTWTRINTGTLGDVITSCDGGISLPPHNTADPPTLYAACIRNTAANGVGFFRSRNGGVDWEHFTVPASTDQQFNYRPVIDPYDANHLLMTGHANPLLVESTDGGEHWTEIVTLDAMRANGLDGGTGDIAFVDDGNAATTRTTWLWLAAQSATNGTWRTTNGGQGQVWTEVDRNEHINGSFQLYQPDTHGVMFMAGVYSMLGTGVLRSEDYGVHWAHVGPTAQAAIVFGTASNVYAMYGWAIGPDGMVDPTLLVAPQPAIDGWTMPGTPSAMTQGPAQAAVSHDGDHAIIVIGAYNAGLWRYVEP